jgi:hypothetical protein
LDEFEVGKLNGKVGGVDSPRRRCENKLYGAVGTILPNNPCLKLSRPAVK